MADVDAIARDAVTGLFRFRLELGRDRAGARMQARRARGRTWRLTSGRHSTRRSSRLCDHDATLRRAEDRDGGSARSTAAVSVARYSTAACVCPAPPAAHSPRRTDTPGPDRAAPITATIRVARTGSRPLTSIQALASG